MSYASEVRGFRDWLPNSFRFATQAEAESFIAQVKAQWIPKDFVRATRILEVDDPTNARWDPKKKDAVKINVKDLAVESKKEETANDYIPPDSLPPPPNIQDFIDQYGRGAAWPFASAEALKHYDAAVEAWRETVRSGDRWYDRQDSLPAREPQEEEQRRSTPADHPDKPPERPLPPIGRGICDDCAKHRGLARQAHPPAGPQEYATCRVCGILRACYEVVVPDVPKPLSRRERMMVADRPSDWQDFEDQILQSPSLRHDMRHVLMHGECQFEITRKIIEGYKAAHGGKLPGDSSHSYTIGGPLSKKKKKLKRLTGQDMQRIVTGALEELPKPLREVFLDKIANPLVERIGPRADAFEKSLSEARALLREAIEGQIGYPATERFLFTGVVSKTFNDGDMVHGASAMQELTGWLNTIEGRALLWDSKTREALSAMKAADSKKRKERAATARARAAKVKAFLDALLAGDEALAREIYPPKVMTARQRKRYAEATARVKAKKAALDDLEVLKKNNPKNYAKLVAAHQKWMADSE